MTTEFDTRMQSALEMATEAVAEVLYNRETASPTPWEQVEEWEKAIYRAKVTEDVLIQVLGRVVKHEEQTPQQRSEAIAFRNFLLGHTNPDQAHVEPESDPHLERTTLLLDNTNPQYRS